MWFCGIDWGEKYLDYCLENNSGDVMQRGRVSNDPGGFSKLFSELTQTEQNLAHIAVAIESPHQPIVEFLIGCGISVYPLNPKGVYDYRKSRKISGSKSDAADAQLIASYIREHHKALHPWCLPRPRLRELQLLVSDRDQLVNEKVRLQNRLRHALLSYYPQALEIFATAQFPTDQRYTLTSQMQRAAVSVAANIAEGSGRGSIPDFLRFLYISQGSLRELVYYIHLANRLGYLSSEADKELDAMAEETARVLTGFIRFKKQEAQAPNS